MVKEAAEAFASCQDRGSLDTLTITIVAAMAAGVGALFLSDLARLPSIVFLLIAGVLLGPSGAALIDPAVFGKALPQAVRIAVVIILFEGALSLNIKELKAKAAETGAIRNLLSIGALITWLGSAAAAHYVGDFSWPISMIFGSILIVTGPTVIGPLLRRVPVQPRLAHILQWEGVLIDPIGALVAILVLEYYLAREPSVAATLVSFFSVLGIGLIVGAVIGVLAGLTLARRSLWPREEEHSGNLFAMAAALLAFGLAEKLHAEAGIMAGTTVGFVLGNMRLYNIQDLKRFGGQVSRLMVAILFLVLAADIELSRLVEVRGSFIAVVALVTFIVRPLNIFASTIGSGLQLREKLFLSWISPRGIVAASVASLMAISLPASDFPGTEFIEPLVFVTISFTVLLQGFTANLVAGWLKVLEPERRGFLIVGAHPFAVAVGRALQAQRIPVMLVDTNLANCIQARLSGLYAAKGNAMDTAFLEKTLLPGIGNILAMTVNDEVNTLACMAAQPLLRSSGLWRILNQPEGESGADPTGPVTAVGQIAFAESCNIAKLSEQTVTEERTIAPVDLTEVTETGADPSKIIYRPVPLFEIHNGKVKVLPPGAELLEGAHTLALTAITSPGA